LCFCAREIFLYGRLFLLVLVVGLSHTLYRLCASFHRNFIFCVPSFFLAGPSTFTLAPLSENFSPVSVFVPRRQTFCAKPLDPRVLFEVPPRTVAPAFLIFLRHFEKIHPPPFGPPRRAPRTAPKIAHCSLEFWASPRRTLLPLASGFHSPYLDSLYSLPKVRSSPTSLPPCPGSLPRAPINTFLSSHVLQAFSCTLSPRSLLHSPLPALLNS